MGTLPRDCLPPSWTLLGLCLDATSRPPPRPRPAAGRRSNPAGDTRTAPCVTDGHRCVLKSLNRPSRCWVVVVCGDLLRFVVVCAGLCWFAMVCCGLLWFVVVSCLWRFVGDCGGLWWFVAWMATIKLVHFIQ